MDESEKAALATRRGQIAVKVDPDRRAKFVAKQGEYERQGKDLTSLVKETEEAEASGGESINVRGSYQRGGTIPQTGVYKLHRGEKVVPATSGVSSKAIDAFHSGVAPKAAPGVPKLGVMPVLGSMEKGGKAKQTGAYFLHEGEEVKPASKAKKTGEKAGAKLGGAKKKGGHKVTKVHVRRSKNKGYIVENEMAPSSPGEPTIPNEEHTYPDLEGVKSHLEEHLSPEEEAAEEKEKLGVSAPAPAGPMVA